MEKEKGEKHLLWRGRGRGSTQHVNQAAVFMQGFCKVYTLCDALCHPGAWHVKLVFWVVCMLVSELSDIWWEDYFLEDKGQNWIFFS